MIQTKLIGTLLTVCGILSAQGPPQQDENATRMAGGSLPIYRVSVTSRTTKAISYQHRSGATKIDFQGTDLLPDGRGEATVQSKQGHIEVDAEFTGLQPATRNGAEYLTYVLWAVTPEGRTANLGEVVLNGTKSKLHVSTDLQVFGLVVTAEPYYAVSQPSDLIVMENVVRADTKGKIEEIDAKYELLQRGQYQRMANPLALKVDRKLPLELYQARNAVQIARAVGADRFATETFGKAEKSLAQAEAYQERHAGEKPVAMAAREAVQMAEDSRAIAVKRQEADELSAEQQQSVNRVALAENGMAAAQSETDRVTREAEAARLQSVAAAQDVKLETEARAAADQAEADRLKRESESRIAAAGVEADRLKRENLEQKAASQAELDSATAAAGVEADRLKRVNQEQQAASQAELDSAAKDKAQLLAEKAELRTELLAQFNAILQTRDTPRGLVVNMSDVLFDTAKFTLRPLAREKLAKVAGIVSGHPGLRLEVEGHTDSVGTDDYNQQLSEQRGAAVRDYLLQQGMAESSVSTKGFGKTQPVASNDTAEGRQQNRRVEIVISGDVIGVEIGKTIAAR